MTDPLPILIALTLIVALILILSSLKRKTPLGEAGRAALKPMTGPGIVEVMGRSSLIEYMPTHNYENATIELVSGFLDTGRDVVLVTQAPRSSMYLERFAASAKKGTLRIVKITTENPLARPQMFRVGSEYNDLDNAKKKTDIVQVPINNLEYLSEITEGMGEGSALIFETLTGLILALGREKMEAVYKFTSSIVEEMSRRGRVLVAFINKGAHPSDTVSAYEGLFVRIFRIEGNSIVSLKGERKKIGFKDSGAD